MSFKKYNSDGIRAECQSFLNGNIADFKEFIKECSKLDILNTIETLESLGHQRYKTINKLRIWLETI